MDKIELKVLGLSYSQTQQGAYALVLEETVGKQRIPIIIGATEAQSIAIEMEGLKSPRPLTHDLFTSFGDAFGIKITEVYIYRIEEGIFYSEIVLTDNKKTIRIDARTSDAIALALRAGCKIFVDKVVLEKTGVILQFEDDVDNEDEVDILLPEKPTQSSPKQKSIKELEKLLQKAIIAEDYEKASKIRDEINKRQGLE